VVQASGLAITGGGAENQREVARAAGLGEAGPEGKGELLGYAGAADRDGVLVQDNAGGRLGT
jgi:hypothetical protein